MIREEQIKGLYALKEYLTKNPIELDGHKSLPITLIDYAIKALEQEPILDKLRAEIKHFMYDINPSSSESDYACNYILQIIDKYKAEIEPQESDIEKRKEWPHKPCINYEDGCEEWAGCPCVYYNAESEDT